MCTGAHTTEAIDLLLLLLLLWLIECRIMGRLCMYSLPSSASSLLCTEGFLLLLYPRRLLSFCHGFFLRHNLHMIRPEEHNHDYGSHGQCLQQEPIMPP